MGVKWVSPQILPLVWGGDVPRRTEKSRRDHKPILSPSPVLWVLAWAGGHPKQDWLGVDHLFLLFVTRGKEISEPRLTRQLFLVLAYLVTRHRCYPHIWPTAGQLAGVNLRLKDVDNGCFHSMSGFGAKTGKKEFSFNSHFPQTSQQEGRGVWRPPKLAICPLLYLIKVLVPQGPVRNFVISFWSVLVSPLLYLNSLQNALHIYAFLGINMWVRKGGMIFLTVQTK